jgi:hypothetical protein
MEIYRRLTRRSNITRNAFKQYAKGYLDTITRIHKELKAKRAEYQSAINENDKLRIKQEFDNIWLTQWPHYTDNEPYPQDNGTEPYPPLKVMNVFSMRDRKFIAKTALSARIGVENPRRFQHLNHKIDAAMSPVYLQRIIKKCIHPPTYPVDIDEIYENEYNSEDFGLMEPTVGRRTRRRRYGRARTPSPIREIAPAYYSPGNTPLRDSSSPPPRYYSPGSRTAGGRNTFSNTFSKKVGKNTRRTRRRRRA